MLLRKRRQKYLNHNQSTSPRRNRTQHSLFTMLFAALIVLVGAASSTQVTNYKVTPTDSNHPIYFNEAHTPQCTQCTTYAEDKHSCMARQPVYNLYDKNAPCEAKVFSQHTSLSCVIKDVQCKEHWIALHNPNVWLFTLCERHLIRIICDDHVSPPTINGTGVITIKPRCILQKKDATVYTYNHLRSKINIETGIDVPTINSSINNMFDLSWSNTQYEIERLQLQKAQERLPDTLTTTMSVHDIYHYVMTTLLLGGLLIGGIFIRRKCCPQTLTATATVNDTIPNNRSDMEIEMQVIRSSTQQRDPVYSEPQPTGTRFKFDN